MADDPDPGPADTPDDESHEEEAPRASADDEPTDTDGEVDEPGGANDEEASEPETSGDDEYDPEEYVEEFDAEEALADAEEYGEGEWEDEADETGEYDEYTVDPTIDPTSDEDPHAAEPVESGLGEDEDLWGDGPETDEEMPLAAHIEEMMRRLAVVFVVGGAVSLAVLGLGEVVSWIPTAVDIIDFLWNHNIPGAPEMKGRRPRIYGPLELLLTKLKVAGLAGILIGLPVFVYETYLFMRPGLYPHERRYYLAAVPTSLILAIIGMSFAHFVVLPAIFEYFTAYTQGTAMVAYGLAETFNLILLLMGYMAIVFQIPLFIMLAIMMGLVTRVWLEEKRLLFWGAFLGLAFLVSPDPTGMAPIIIATTMVVLYEGTLALLRWTGN